MNAPSTDKAEEILARCLTDPLFLSALIVDRAATIRGIGLDVGTRAKFAKLDLARVRKFSGFIGKVQHNFLWDHFPATRQLLNFYEIEIEVFAEYRSIQLSGALKAQSQPVKIRRFLNFLFEYIMIHPEYSAVRTVARYEETVWEHHQLMHSADVPILPRGLGKLKETSWSHMLRLVPMHYGPMRIEAFDCNPATLVASVLDGTFSGYVPRAKLLIAFRSDPASGLIRTFEIDELTALLLSCIDGRRAIRSVIATARKRVLATLPPRTFRTFFEDATASGIIGFAEEFQSCG